MESKSHAFIKNLFREYYEDYPPDTLVTKMEQREFGFTSFSGLMQRHVSFQNSAELKNFLKNFVPLDAYYSCAYYVHPEADMEMKGWLGADLIFDIDADHIPTSCDKAHDEWKCGSCNFIGKGLTPEKCPICGSEKFDTNTWPCEECLNSAKMETIKLLEMLEQDFGFSKSEVRTFFSGHRGYHVHVESDTVKTLDAMERKEIVDYVSALGLNIENIIPAEESSREFVRNFGWPKRLVMGIENFIACASEEDLLNLGLERRFVGAVMRNKGLIIKSLQSKGILRYVRGVGPQTWARVVKHIMKLKSASVDTVVTTDTHRLIRLADTLNGKTGFKKVEFSASAIDNFDPFKMAVALKGGSVAVKVYDAPEFRIGDETFGPYKNQIVELPAAAAVLLICRNRAEVVT